MEIHRPQRPRRSLKEFLVEIVMITVGVLIALSFEGAREWNRERTLVRDARANIAHEMADNRKDLEATLSGMSDWMKNVNKSLQFADELIRTKKTSVHQLNLSFNLADLSTASWQTAERTGALGHMKYAEVQKYSVVYSHQTLFSDQQRRTLDQMAPHAQPPGRRSRSHSGVNRGVGGLSSAGARAACAPHDGRAARAAPFAKLCQGAGITALLPASSQPEIPVESPILDGLR